MSFAAPEPPAQDCDRFAAHPNDSNRVAEGVPFDQILSDDAISACQTAVETYPDSPRLTFQLARALDAAGRSSEANHHYEIAARSNYAAAQINLGYSYHYGHGVELDYSVAAKWFRRAADNGDPYGLTMLGQLHMIGAGFKENDEKAAKLYEQAAKQGEPVAQGRLGFMTFFGFGVDRDAETAARWLLAAGEQAEPLALYTLGYDIFLRGEGKTRDVDKAFYWLRLAAERGSTRAQKQLAYMYLRIVEVHPKPLYGRSKDEALDWINRSVQLDYPSALISLAFLHSTGTAVPKDCTRARQLIRAAQDLEDSRAEERDMVPDNPNMPMGFVELGKRYELVGNCRD